MRISSGQISVCIVCGLLLIAVGCGSSNQTVPPAPAAPQFTTASLNGTYAFTVNGFSANVLPISGRTESGLYSLTGTFVTDGLGNITQGHTFYTVNLLTGIGPGGFGNQDFSGTYTVRSDGRGTATLSTQILGPVAFDFVLASAQHGQLIRFDDDASPSGTLDQLNTSLGVPDLSGAWAFNLSGTDGAGNPKAMVGVFSFDNSGLITTGTVDSNDNGTIHANVPIQTGPASEMQVLTGSGRGGVSFSAGTDPIESYIATIVDANHMRLQSGDFDLLTGDAYRVIGTSFLPSLAFTMAGTGANGAFATGGILNTDGLGTILTTSVRDTNNAGTLTLNSATTGTYSKSGNRFSISLNGGATNLVAYPSTGGFQLLEIDGNAVASGVALPQTGSFSNGTLNGSYGATLAGTGSGRQFGIVAQVTANGAGQLSGALNLNDGGTLSSDLTLNGLYSFSANGRASGSIATSTGSRNVIFYAADNNQALFIETDPAQIGQGTLARQQ